MSLSSIGLALMVSVTAQVGSDPNLYQEQTWEAPTHDEINNCAAMAQSLNVGFDYLIAQGLNRDWQIKTATCEVYLLDEPPEDQAEIRPAAKKVSFKF